MYHLHLQALNSCEDWCLLYKNEVNNLCSSYLAEWLDHGFEAFCKLYDFPGGSDGKASAYNVGDPGSIPGSGRSPGEGNGNPLQCSCLENPKDGEAW